MLRQALQIYAWHILCASLHMYNNLNNNNSIPNPAAYIQKLNIFSYLLVNYSQLCQLCGGAWVNADPARGAWHLLTFRGIPASAACGHAASGQDQVWGGVQCLHWTVSMLI